MKRNVLAVCLMLSLFLAQGASAERTTVTHWYSGPYATFNFVKAQVPAFEAANPDLKVELVFVSSNEWNEKYSVMFATDIPVDVIWTNNNNNLPYYMALDLLTPLNAYAEKVGLDFSDFVAPVIQQATKDGKTYAVPYAALPSPGLFYNGDMYDTVGLSYPSDNWHYQNEFLAANKKLTQDTNGDGQPDQFGISSQLAPSRRGGDYVLLEAFGGRILSLDGTKATVTKSETMAGLGFLQSLAHQEKVMGGSFWNGSAAMDIDGFWAIPGFTATLKGARTSVAALPIGPAGRKVSFLAGYYSVPRNSRNPEAAMRWIKHLTSDKVSKDWLRAKLNLTGKLRINAAPEFTQDEMTRKWISFYGFEGMAPIVPANFKIADVDKAFENTLVEMSQNKSSLVQIAEKLQHELTVILSEPLQ